MSGAHGLCFAITEPTYEYGKLDQQEAWGIETDSFEEEQVWDLDETHGNPNGGEIAFETPEPDADPLRIGLTYREDVNDGNRNVDIISHVTGKFEDFIREPNTQRGMKYLDAMCLASFIEDQARTDGGFVEEGAVPELEGAEIHVYDDRIEYALDEEIEITRESNLSTPEMDSTTDTQSTAD